MKLILTGFMGSGKTVVAEHLGKKLGFDVLEMDQVILERVGVKNMEELFKKGGEILLRTWEVMLAREWRDLTRAIISTGGGVVMNKIIIDYLKEGNGKVIYLHAPFQVIRTRVKLDPTRRPLFRNIDDALALYEFRQPLYKHYADIVVNTQNKTPEQVLQTILKKL